MMPGQLADPGRAGSAPEPVIVRDGDAGEGGELPEGLGAVRAPDEAVPEPYQRPNPETIEDADELRASVERVIRRAGRRFREEQQRLVEAGIVDEAGHLLAPAVSGDVATGAENDDR
jgi:hypothetical protein